MSGKAIRETVGFLAVVASLVFVGWEIRQNTAVARAAAAQAFTQQIIDHNAILVAEGYPALNTRMAEGELRADFNSDDQMRIDVTAMSTLRIWESLFRGVQVGIVDEELLNPLGGAGPSPFDYPYFIESWPFYRGGFTEDFASYFEARRGL